MSKHMTRDSLKRPCRRGANWPLIPSGTISLVTISLLVAASSALAQSIKGNQQPGQRLQPVTTTSPATTFQSPVGQLRQKQQQQQVDYSQQQQPRGSSQIATTPSSTKRRTSQQAPIQQQQLLADNYREERLQNQQQQQQQQSATEDPLADSEPALYGSVAGAPGVDFPAYTQIPKTSFTCEGKGFDFGFYADEEAQCQVYHVCWSGRRESFLCGVGTVFNQAILACDYWHSVDCSKSSQFYGVNSELGKAGAEPASGSQQLQAPRSRPISPANLPARDSKTNQFDDRQQQQISVSSNSFGEPLNQRRITQQQQQSYANEDNSFDTPQQQQQQPAPKLAQTYQTGSTGGSGNAGFNQQRIEPDAKGANRVQTSYAPVTTPASRSRFNMDFNQKVNSLIESPVRAPLSKTSSVKRQSASSPPPPPVATKFAATTTTRRPFQLQQQVPNSAQLAVSRAEQKAQSQTQKSKPIQQTRYTPQQRVQEQQQLDSDLNEPQQQQQQQQNFDDLPVQTSTTPAIQQQRVYNNNNQQRQNNNQFAQQQLVIQSGGNSPDGSSAITTQYDTMTPVSQFNQPQQQQQQQQQQSNQDYGQDSSYDSTLDDPQSNDDFRSSGAKAAASHNQNWYIMRTI